MKQTAHQVLRTLHKKILFKDLNGRIAIYFHSVEPHFYDIFKESILFFKKSGYRFVFPQTFVSSNDEGKRVFLSFDDNYFSWYPLLEVLDQLEIKASFFINTIPIREAASDKIIGDYFDRLKYAGDQRTLSKTEIRMLKKRGHNIGDHTHSHFMLTRIPIQKAKEEIKKGKDILEDILGEEVSDFSFPFGMRRHFNQELRDYASSIGLKTISNAVSSLQYKTHQRLDINRTLWDLQKSLCENITNLQIDGRMFVNLTGRSPLGI